MSARWGCLVSYIDGAYTDSCCERLEEPDVGWYPPIMIFMQAAGKLWVYPDQEAADRGRAYRNSLSEERGEWFLPTTIDADDSGAVGEVADILERPIPRPANPEESKRAEKAIHAISADMLAVKALYTLEEVAA
jgi:hypothetical protein